AANPMPANPVAVTASEQVSASATSDESARPDTSNLAPAPALPHGGLVAPLPGTAAGAKPAAGNRPWQSLRKPTDRKSTSAWALPNPAFLDRIKGIFDTQTPGKNPELVPVAPGEDTDKPVADEDVVPRDPDSPTAPK